MPKRDPIETLRNALAIFVGGVCATAAAAYGLAGLATGSTVLVGRASGAVIMEGPLLWPSCLASIGLGAFLSTYFLWPIVPSLAPFQDLGVAGALLLLFVAAGWLAWAVFTL